MNLIAGTYCPSVVCVPAPKPGQPPTPVFRYQDEAGEWHPCDRLPDEIAAALPGPEWSRCEVHAWRRLSDRKAAS